MKPRKKRTRSPHEHATPDVLPEPEPVRLVHVDRSEPADRPTERYDIEREDVPSCIGPDEVAVDPRDEH
jgi:hypothetical protein